MPSVSRETVSAAVQEYGIAWETQNVERIGHLFTQDAIYVERAFDKKATFRGREAIKEYWRYQICGKQRNIAFRHVESEMVRDADRPIAVVKWLAEFDNHREHRGPDSTKANKRVRFCQMAKLIFCQDKEQNDDNKSDTATTTQICYLEEYAQSMTGRHVRWPGLQATEEELYSKIRFDGPKPPLPVVCERCNTTFPSRTKLFQHLGETITATIGKDGNELGCIPILKEQESEDVLVCLSISYYCHPQHPQTYVLNALQSLLPNKSTDDTTIVWAVPPELSLSAVVNVITLKMSRRSVIQDASSNLPKLLNDVIMEKGRKSNNNNDSDDDTFLKVHSAGLVDRSFAIQRRDFEKYVAFIPWTLLSNTSKDPQHEELSKEDDDTQQEGQQKVENQDHDSPNVTTTTTADASPEKWRTPLEDTAAFRYINAKAAGRLKHATRLMKDGGLTDLGAFSDHLYKPKIRVRTSCMVEPWHRYCRITISMKQPSAGYVQYLIALLVAYTRFSEMKEEDFRGVLDRMRDSTTTASEVGSNKNVIVPIPSEFVILLEPSMSRYEDKINLCLCSSHLHASDALKGSIATAEQVILETLEKNEHLLEHWIEKMDNVDMGKIK